MMMTRKKKKRKEEEEKLEQQKFQPPKEPKMEIENNKKWSRNLYEKKHDDYPDNYTPDDVFLKAIERNKNVNKYEIVQCITNACQVGLQFCSVMLFQASYHFLSAKIMSSSHLLLIMTVLSCSGYLVLALKNRLSAREVLLDLRHVAIFLSFGLGLAPVLYKLTDTISTDTIDTTSSLAIAIHLLTHNYHPKTVNYSSTALSFNAALFASVCLASRLDSSWDAFVLLVVALVAFLLFPVSRSHFRWIRTVFSFLLTLVIASCISMKMALGVLLMLGLLVLAAPFMFVRWQDYKKTIHGPWDEAVPNI